jgi:glyoxalase family protein
MLEGLHHITAITGDAPRNVDFYVRVLGLRFVKKTVNFDAPDVYHLYYGDEVGTPGSILTFFEFPGAQRGRHGAGAAYRVEWRVASVASLAFWARRLEGEGVATRALGEDGLWFADPEGLEHALLVADVPDAPLRAVFPGIPEEHAIAGFHGARAYPAGDPAASAPALTAVGLVEVAAGVWEAAGEQRRGRFSWDEAPGRHVEGAGSIHHLAWNAADDAELTAIREAAVGAGEHPTPIVDRQYFHSVYHRLPSGVLFEHATRDIGFALDEPVEALGRSLMLPPQHEARRAHLERTLTPLPDPRADAGL